MVTIFIAIIGTMFLGSMAYLGLWMTGAADEDSPLMQRLRENTDAFREIVGEIGLDDAFELFEVVANVGLEIGSQALRVGGEAFGTAAELAANAGELLVALLEGAFHVLGFMLECLGGLGG